ncbi:MAG: TadE family protein [Burkholderiales bacterium]
MNTWRKKSLRSQHGAAVVETALVFLFFFLLLCGIIEFGRAFFVWNTVQEVTRNAARSATVADFNDAAALSRVRQTAIFRTDSGPLIVMPEITDASILIRYLNASRTQASPSPRCQAENIRNCITDPNANNCIRFVEVTICGAGGNNGACGNISYTPWLPILGGAFDALTPNITIPKSRVVMPAETLGYTPGLPDC